jgi:hypothetical protein
MIGLALHAVERGLGTLAIEVSIGPDGAVETSILFDDDGDREAVVLQVGM